MVWLYRSPIPVERSGVISLFKWFLHAFPRVEEGGGGGEGRQPVFVLHIGGWDCNEGGGATQGGQAELEGPEVEYTYIEQPKKSLLMKSFAPMVLVIHPYLERWRRWIDRKIIREVRCTISVRVVFYPHQNRHPELRSLMVGIVF